MTGSRAPAIHASRGLHALAPAAWCLLVVGVVLLAIYVAAGRFLVSQLPALRDPLLAQINQRLPFTVEVSQLSGRWASFSPELQFNGLRLIRDDPQDPDSDSSPPPPISIGSGSLRVDVPASIASGTLQLSQLRITELTLNARLKDDGSIGVEGFSGGGEGGLQAWLEEFLPNVERVELASNTMQIMLGQRRIDLQLDLALAREGNARSLEGRLQSPELSLLVNAHGVGNPLRPLSWRGDVYLDARSSDLSAFEGVFNSLDWPFRLSGEARTEFWLTRDQGDSTARLRWDSQALQLDEKNGAWSLPLDASSFEAALDQRSRHWSLLTEDLHIERAGQILDLQRAQFDWWGQALRVRATDLSLAALPTLLAAAPGVPDGLREVLPVLAPRGRLASVELRLDDLSSPAQSWSVRSVINDLSIESWRNAPAVTGVSGYLSLAPGVGTLQLDAQAVSMHFPSVYKEPLYYNDALGDVHLAWDSEGLRVDSGLMILQDRDAEARGLFAVDIPFQPRVTGVELELLIGMQDSRVENNAHYLPYKLPDSLLGWLERSDAQGELTRAGFVFRGSVKRDRRAHKTLQLFLDASDAAFVYDPAWPAIDRAQATVWVDDVRTWARADNAVSQGATLNELMVSVLPEGRSAQVTIGGAVDSDAQTAGLLLRDTPLREITKDLFSEWTFEGRVHGNVDLQLTVGQQPRPPVLDLALQLEDVSARIAQIDLHTETINGELRYQSSTGFDGSQVQLRTLGGETSVVATDSLTDGLELTMQGSVSAPRIAEWLELPVLRFAQGESSYTGELRVPRDVKSSLALRSDLQGISLDAPRPYGKGASQPLPLELSMPLESGPVVSLSLGDRLRMNLELEDDGLKQLVAVVGGGMPDAPACDRLYCLGGTISSLDIAQWADFYQQYVRAPGPGSSPGDADISEQANTARADSFSYRIDALQVGELRLATRSFGRSTVDVWGVDQRWEGALQSSSVSGSLRRRDSDLNLELEVLDLARFRGGEPTALSALRGLVPTMHVDVRELKDGDTRWGALSMHLDMSQPDGAMYASDIQGTLFGMRMEEPRSALLRWSDDTGQELTELEVDFAFDDFGTVLQEAGYAPTLESESGGASVRLQWPGSPADFDAGASTGSLTLTARNGRVLESRPGALAMISVLNLAEILRGLSLSHMFDAGIPFIRASSEMYFHRGTLEIADLHIDGAASAFAFNGLSDLQEGSINGELVVTLPVANNLPWVAALAAGIPVAAGVFVVSKVFQKQVNRMSSAVYGVSGDIQAPELEFRRLFDDQLKPATPAAPADNETGVD